MQCPEVASQGADVRVFEFLRDFQDDSQQNTCGNQHLSIWEMPCAVTPCQMISAITKIATPRTPT